MYRSSFYGRHPLPAAGAMPSVQYGSVVGVRLRAVLARIYGGSVG